MGRTQALKEAQKRYMAKIKGTPQGDKIYEKLKELILQVKKILFGCRRWSVKSIKKIIW